MGCPGIDVLDSGLLPPHGTDADRDGLADDEYFVKGTDPTRVDTDRDGHADGVDRLPLGDAFVEVLVTTTRASAGGSRSTGRPRPRGPSR